MNAVMQSYSQSKIHAHKVALWVAIGSMVMMFGAFTSAYIVRRAQGNWLEFKLPSVFFISTVVILASSATLQLCLNAFRAGEEKRYKAFMVATAILGIGFLVLQYQGWLAMNAIGAGFTANPSSSFVYVISGVHAAHLLGGLGAMTMALIHAFHLPFKPTPRRILRLELVTTYWHFVDILWVYLLLFFVLQS